MPAALRTLILLLLVLATACVGPQRARRAESKVALGQAYLQERNPEGAIQILREAVKLNPSSWEAWDHLGIALTEKNQHDQAEDSFKRSIRLAHGNAEPHLNYGMLLFKTGRVDLAIEQYHLALKDLTYRKPAIILNNLGYALHVQGKHEEAISALQDAISRAPNFCLGRYNLGLALRGAARLDESLAAYEQVVLVCPNEAYGAYFEAGSLYFERGDYDRAVRYLREVERRDPGTPTAREATRLLGEAGY